METINDRIRIIKDYYFKPSHGSRKRMAELLNESPNKVGNWMIKGYPVGREVLDKITKAFPDVNYEWLATGKEDMLKNHITSPYNSNYVGDGTVDIPLKYFMLIEFVDLETATGILWKKENDVPISSKRVVLSENDNGNYLVARVHGHSMDDGTKRSICEDDELLIKQFLDSYKLLPIRQKLFVICTLGGSVIKQIMKIDFDRQAIICHSFNANYPEYEIRFSEILQLFTIEKKIQSKIFF